MYGEIFKTEIPSKLKHLCDKRDTVVAHKFFDDNYSWREKSDKGLFSLEFKSAGYTEAMMNNDIPLLDKPVELQNLIVFFKMV